MIIFVASGLLLTIQAGTIFIMLMILMRSSLRGARYMNRVVIINMSARAANPKRTIRSVCLSLSIV